MCVQGSAAPQGGVTPGVTAVLKCLPAANVSTTVRSPRWLPVGEKVCGPRMVQSQPEPVRGRLGSGEGVAFL